MSLKLSGKTALVTGASEQLQSIWLHMAPFVILNARSASNLEKEVQEIQQKGGKATSIPADVSKMDEIKSLFD
eukprot:CAMPEP_0168566310 /NCGR_PEP_ID=MMETSP0413-20121227/14349_1 /TAXON_ID=136452 /ORGANISM="Filamoeba nolandi, Strain NC-AS-23-1" /LENGTH=72 /DNA_ID=CAMNT_0008598317 /DNA_START=33 /DNA_END=248 /DNA_ORIENTATION=-